MKRLTLGTILLAIIALAALGMGCSAQTGNVFGPVTDGVADTSSVPPNAPVPQESYGSSNSAGGVAAQNKSVPAAQPTVGDATQAQDQQRMIVYTGSMSLQVNDTTDTVNKITDLLKSVNGYIASRSLVAYGKDKQRGTISIRVPAATLDTVLAQIRALGVKVLKEDQQSNDVTEEYTDLDAQRKNLEAYEVELQQLLDTVREKTGKAEDILAVYNQLTQVRGQIDQITGRQRYLANTSSLATYTIELVPVEEIVVQGDPGWNPGGTAKLALDKLVKTMQGLGDLTINLALYVIPVLIVVLLPFLVAFLIVRAILKRRTTKKVVPAS